METIRAHQLKEGVSGRRKRLKMIGWEGVCVCAKGVCGIFPERLSAVSHLPRYRLTPSPQGEVAIINAEDLLAAMCASRHWWTDGCRVSGINYSEGAPPGLQGAGDNATRVMNNSWYLRRLPPPTSLPNHLLISRDGWSQIKTESRADRQHQGDPPQGDGLNNHNEKAPAHPILHRPRCARNAHLAGHFYLNERNFLAVNFGRHGDMAWLAAHMASLPSLECRNMKDKLSHHSDSAALLKLPSQGGICRSIPALVSVLGRSRFQCQGVSDLKTIYYKISNKTSSVLRF